VGETTAPKVSPETKDAAAPKMTAAQKATEIEQTRTRLEGDLQELEDRIPAPLRSMKSLVGLLVTTTGGLIVMKRLLGKKKNDENKAEVVIRVMRDDVEVERRR
jgi:hypothetical protein